MCLSVTIPGPLIGSGGAGMVLCGGAGIVLCGGAGIVPSSASSLYCNRGDFVYVTPFESLSSSDAGNT